MNTKCNATAHVQEYCDTICNETNRHKQCKEEICNNKTEWISKQTDSFILDPHNCQSSCKNPSRGCNACTNEYDYFNCTKSGVCIPRELRCDGHKHCQHGEDEEYDYCYPIYIENGVIQKYGTLRCPHITYSGIETVAVVCNGIPECVNSEDEPDICNDSDLTFYIIGSLVVVIVLWNMIERLILNHQNSGELSVQCFEMVRTSQLDDVTSYRDFHSSESFKAKMNVLLAELKYSKNPVRMKEVCNQILNFEQTIHENNENKIVLCLHKQLKPKLFNMIMEVFNPGLIDGRAPSLRERFN